MESGRVEWHLQNWTEWQRHGSVGRGYPSRASGGMGVSGSSDFDSMCGSSDAVCAAAVDALITGLPGPQRWTISNIHLGTVLRFRGSTDIDTLEMLYETAKENIGRGLDARGVP